MPGSPTVVTDYCTAPSNRVHVATSGMLSSRNPSQTPSPRRVPKGSSEAEAHVNYHCPDISVRPAVRQRVPSLSTRLRPRPDGARRADGRHATPFRFRRSSVNRSPAVQHGRRRTGDGDGARSQFKRRTGRGWCLAGSGRKRSSVSWISLIAMKRNVSYAGGSKPQYEYSNL
ncbi:hypothetical protein MPTK1_5g03710 [Marchantia polymorpha subsp. ruderalis]|uniref:Uncharacterized protein n=2 Tax=Marchantia polymorpha TaxID=3197 RepID=A0AAF6BEM3_MARPO|nr:hypothetical protein MARPO_0133s0018 [Marchantia polymorpha]BBN10457.1 hypothetical protein Mp_5g03710 [Marchantia polymorpha subsp. ruderalis]|eukprot:PTQ29869.1 hypothetical protein MARPO_0133s0018 [Marchantia polymorpha]